MKNEIIYIETQCLEKDALKYFIKASGLKEDKEKDLLILDHATSYKNKMLESIQVKALVSSYPSDVFYDDQIHIEDLIFTGLAFKDLEQRKIKNIYPYILNVAFKEENNDLSMMEQFFIHIWANAYINSGLEALKDILLRHCIEEKGEKEDNLLIEGFSPGLQGIDISQVNKLFLILEGERIGVKVTENSLMIPAKSHAGFFIVHEALQDSLHKSHSKYCKDCNLNNSGCSFCLHYKKRQDSPGI